MMYLRFSAGLGCGFGRAGMVALVLVFAAGCSTSSNVDVMLFADPGKYEHQTCEQISAAGKSVADREARLRQLIQKAEQGAAGGLVGAVAYRGEHRTVVEELAVIEGASRRKNCTTPPNWRSTTAIQ
jgi:hypothetical protein